MVQDVVRRDPNLIGQGSPLAGEGLSSGGQIVEQVLQVCPSYSILTEKLRKLAAKAIFDCRTRERHRGLRQAKYITVGGLPQVHELGTGDTREGQMRQLNGAFDNSRDPFEEISTVELIQKNGIAEKVGGPIRGLRSEGFAPFNDFSQGLVNCVVKVQVAARAIGTLGVHAKSFSLAKEMSGQRGGCGLFHVSSKGAARCRVQLYACSSASS